MSTNEDFTPSDKSPQIDEALKKIFGVDRRETILNKGCVTCEDPDLNFRDETSRREYEISGMCQRCQDSVFDDIDINDPEFDDEAYDENDNLDEDGPDYDIEESYNIEESFDEGDVDSVVDENVKYPDITVELTNSNGNAFALMGKVQRALINAGASPKDVKQFIDQAKSGDYDNVLLTCMEWVNVV